MHTRSLACFVCLALAGACTSAQENGLATSDSTSGAAMATESTASDARQAIDAAMARYVDAVKRGDTAAIAAAYTDDAIVVMPSGPPMKGRSEVSKGFANMLTASSVKELRSSKVDRSVAGQHVVLETGSFEVTMQPRTIGPEVTDKGQYMVVWQRQNDGSWRIARAFNRLDTPPKS